MSAIPSKSIQLKGPISRFAQSQHLIFAIPHKRQCHQMNPITAQMLLLKCTGDEIWNEQTCREAGVPQAWIEELVDNFESGFNSDRNKIYENEQLVNQYRGVLDLHLAYKLAEFLNIDWQRVTSGAIGRRAEVAAIIAELDEL